MIAESFSAIFPDAAASATPKSVDENPFENLLAQAPSAVESRGIAPEEIARARRIGDFLLRPAKELIDDETFDPISAYRDPDFSGDVEAQRKVLEIFKARENESPPFRSTLKFLGAAGKGLAWDLPKAMATSAGVIPAQITNIIEGVIHNNPDRAMSAAGELIASGEANAEGMLGLAERAGIKLLDGKPKNDRQWEILITKLGDIRERQAATERGEGRILKSTIGRTPAEFAADQGGTIEPENVVAAEPLADPTLLLGVGLGAKAARAAVPSLAARGTEVAIQGTARAAKAVAAPALATAGKVATTVGNAGAKLGSLPVVAAGAELAGGMSGAPVVGTYVAGKFGPKAIQKVGRTLTDAAASVAGSVPPGPIMRAAGAVLDSDLRKILTTGATAGVVGDPLAAAFTSLNLLGAENAEQAGQMIGMQAGAGAGGAAMSGATAALKPYFDLNEQAFGSRQASGEATKPVTSPAYGTSANLDAAHTEALASLPQWAQNRINAFREAIRNTGKQLYVLPEGDFGRQIADIFEQQAIANGKILTPEQLAGYAADAANSNGVFAEKLRVGDKTIDAIFMRADDTSLGHEGSHVIEKLVSPEQRKAIYDSVLKNFSPDELKTFSDQYTSLLKQTDPNFVMTPDRLASEIFAEIGSVALNGVPLDTLNLPKPVQRAVYQGLLKVFSKLGYDTGNTALGLRRDPFVAALAENVFRSEAASRNPPAPVATKTNPLNVKIAPARPSSPIKNIRSTAETQNRFRQEADADYSRAAAAVDASTTLTPAQRNAFVNVSANLAQGGSNPHPIEIEYNSVKAGDFQSGRTVRRSEQEAAYGADIPEKVRALVQKILVPTRFLVTKDGGVQLLGMSLDKVTANASIVARDAASNKASDLIPYQTSGGKLTETGWRDLVKDVQTYTANQANGYAGNGKPVVVPKDYKGDIPAQNGAYTPVPLADDKANFVNVLMALPPPRSTALKAKTASGVPANIIARDLANANAKPILQSITSNPKANFFDQYGVEIAEFNPLRDALARKGVKVRDLIEVTERVNLNEIKDIKIRNDLTLSRPVTDLIRAGFMPDPKKASRSGNQDVRDVADEYTKKAGIPYRPYDSYVKPPEELLKSIADWYDKAQSSPQDPAVQSAYKALIDQTTAQYHAMLDAGYTIEPWTDTKGEPYKSSADMVRDVKENKHLWFYPTKNGFGSREFDVSTNPLLAQVEGTPHVANDIFRAVHDFYGHAKEGYEFGPRGEFNAFLAHSSMFTPEAIPALASETLAQNAWVNAGPHLRREDGSLPAKGDKDFKPLTERPFADQKVLAVPQDLLAQALAQKGPTVEPLGKKHLVMEGVGEPVEQFQVRKPGEDRGTTMTREEAQRAAPDAKFSPGEKQKAEEHLREFRGKTVLDAIKKPDWAILTATQESVGGHSDPKNVEANKNLESDLTKDGYPHATVKGSYAGVDQGDNFLVTGIPGPEARKLGDKYNQESVLTDRGLVYSDGTINPINPSENKVGESARSGYHTVLPDGTPFSAGIDFSKRTSGAEVKFMPKAPQHAAKEPLPDAVGKENVPVTHYTSQGDLKTVDPKFMKPKAGTFQKMYRGENKAFFFVGDSKPLEGENVSAKGKPVKYEATISGTRLYDMDADPRDLWFAKNPAKADQQLMDAGYSGYKVTTGDGRQFVAMYEPTRVTKVKQESTPQSTKKAADYQLGEVSVSVKDDYLAARSDGGELTKAQEKDLIKKAILLGKDSVTFDNGNDVQTIWESGPTSKFHPAVKLGNEEGQLAEEAKLGNSWLSPEGRFYRTGGDHGDWAKSKLVYPSQKDAPKARHEYETALKDLGWVRISLEREGRGIFLDGRSKTPKQEAALDVFQKLHPDEEFIDLTRGVRFMPKTGKEAKAYRDISPYLTEAERAEMRNDVATDLVKTFKELPQDEEFQIAVEAGGSKQGWYSRAAESLRKMFGEDTDKFVTLLAATSPRQRVDENLLMSLRIWNDWTKAGRPTDHAETKGIVERYAEMDNRVKNSVTALLEGKDLRQPLDKDATISGFKVESFKRNLLGDSNAVTNDTWMALFSGVDQSLFETKSGYLATAAKVRRVAETMEVSPAEVQEAVWSFYKTLIEKTTLDRPAKETLHAITEKDIAETPEFYELLHSHPEIQSQLVKAGVVTVDSDGRPELSHLVDPEYAGRRAAASSEPIIRPAGGDRARILERVAIRAQRVKDVMLQKRADSRAANEAGY